MAQFISVFPKRLIEILDDETFVKAGVNILGNYHRTPVRFTCLINSTHLGDAQRLYQDYGVTVRSCIELSYLARCVDQDRWSGDHRNLIGLSRLVQTYMGFTLSKTSTRSGNWDDVLTNAQKLCMLEYRFLFTRAVAYIDTLLRCLSLHRCCE